MRWKLALHFMIRPKKKKERKKKKESCLVVLHHPPLIFENWKKVFTVQKYTAPYFQNSIKVFFSLKILIF